jgi:acetyl-CoA carboxylase biotin carboxylase subunit
MDRMSRALDEFVVTGIKTTVPLHKAIMKDPNFRRGRYSTNFIESLLGFSRKPLLDVVSASG